MSTDRYTATPQSARIAALIEIESRRHRLDKLAMSMQDTGAYVTARILSESADALADKSQRMREQIAYIAGE